MAVVVLVIVLVAVVTTLAVIASLGLLATTYILARKHRKSTGFCAQIVSYNTYIYKYAYI